MWKLWKLWKKPQKALKTGFFRQRNIHRGKRKVFHALSVDIVDKSEGEEGFADIYNISGSHSYQQVPVDTICQNKFFNFLKGVEVIAFFPSLYDTVPDICGTDPQGVRFPGGVDVRQDYPVRQAEGRGKIVQKSFGAAVGMGLEHAPEGFVGIIAGRF